MSPHPTSRRQQIADLRAKPTRLEEARRKRADFVGDVRKFEELIESLGEQCGREERRIENREKEVARREARLVELRGANAALEKTIATQASRALSILLYQSTLSIPLNLFPSINPLFQSSSVNPLSIPLYLFPSTETPLAQEVSKEDQARMMKEGARLHAAMEAATDKRKEVEEAADSSETEAREAMEELQGRVGSYNAALHRLQVRGVECVVDVRQVWRT